MNSRTFHIAYFFRLRGHSVYGDLCIQFRAEKVKMSGELVEDCRKKIIELQTEDAKPDDGVVIILTLIELEE